MSTQEPTTNNVVVDRIPQRVERIDLLFMVDNSLSMADKQALLAEAVPRLVERLVDPLCVPRQGSAEPQPPTAGACPDGFKREFVSVADIHIGVITSALGSHGGNGCKDATFENDGARLMPFVRAGDKLASYGNAGFLDWDPYAAKQPPGTSDHNVLVQDFAAHVRAARETGCGYEASLEAWYRFLIDPEPPLTLRVENYVTIAEGVDQALLDQRRAFLRPDSLVAVIMLTDENDCSVTDHGIGSLPMTTSAAMFRGSSDCARDPNSACCRFCAIDEPAPPPGCIPLKDDVECKKGPFEEKADSIHMRCFDQKRRFGFDFLHPISRYVDGLKNAVVPNRAGELVPNPLYQDLAQGGPAVRAPGSGLVFLAGIVGVPWQDIATPESVQGPGLEYLPAREIPWDLILADPNTGRPKDPLMFESMIPRVGAPAHPITGAPIAGPDAPSAESNPINGHEHLSPIDLQYACIFPLDTDFATPGLQPRDCATVDTNCDCAVSEVTNPVGSNKPLCQDPNTGAYTTVQRYAKAYPGVRHLEVLKDLGENAIVASICPKVIDGDSRAPSFGYNPAVDAIIDGLSEGLRGSCLPRPLEVDRDGSVPCKVVETLRLGSGQTCDCSLPGRAEPDPAIVPAVHRRMAEIDLCGGTTGVDCASQCLCEILPAEGGSDDDGGCSSVDTPREACQCEDEPRNVVGYCYIDPEKGIGAPSLVEDCRDSAPRLVRLVGTPQAPTPRGGSTVFVACIGAPLE